jgi:aminocarboxymuconate-semialdehyde decarboxylase
VTKSAARNGGGALVDVHTHFFPEPLYRAIKVRTEPPYLHRDGEGTFVRIGAARQYPLTAEMRDIDAKLEQMDRSGVDHSVLSVNMPAVDGLGELSVTVAREVNDAMAAAASRDPQRLSWLATVPMENPDAVAAELRRCAVLGARGVMIGSNVNGRPLDLEQDAGLFEAAHDLDLAVMMHPSFPLSNETVSEYQLTSILGFLFDTTTATMRLVLAGLFDRYPKLKLVISHVGGLLPFIVGRIDYLSMQRPGGLGELDRAPSEHLRKLYVDAVCLWPPALRLGVEFFGADHVMFGSDHPYWPMPDSVETLDVAGLTPSQARAVGHDTAVAVMGIA